MKILIINTFMNIMLLSPERSGTVLLHRILSLYAYDKFDKPAINTYEIVHGIENTYSEYFKQTVLNECPPQQQHYKQTLPEVIELLKNADHYIIAQMMHRHLKKRNDPIHEMSALCEYVNKEFFIISCQRKSIFEYALSYGIRTNSKMDHVYTHQQKAEKYTKLFKNKVTIPREAFINYLNIHKNHTEWINTYFDINSVYTYEEHMHVIDNYVQNLSCFAGINNSSWKDDYGMDWAEWNKCHKLFSDLGVINHTSLLEMKNTTAITPAVVQHLPVSEQKFLEKNAITYMKSANIIKKLVNDGVLTHGVPIKLQTLVEKKMIVENFDECAIIYNEWADKNGYDIIKDTAQLINEAHAELKHWYDEIPSNLLDVGEKHNGTS